MPVLGCWLYIYASNASKLMKMWSTQVLVKSMCLQKRCQIMAEASIIPKKLYDNQTSSRKFTEDEFQTELCLCPVIFQSIWRSWMRGCCPWWRKVKHTNLPTLANRGKRRADVCKVCGNTELKILRLKICGNFALKILRLTIHSLCFAPYPFDSVGKACPWSD